jgi:hypothetical protein
VDALIKADGADLSNARDGLLAGCWRNPVPNLKAVDFVSAHDVAVTVATIASVESGETGLPGGAAAKGSVGRPESRRMHGNLY